MSISSDVHCRGWFADPMEIRLLDLNAAPLSRQSEQNSSNRNFDYAPSHSHVRSLQSREL